MKTYDGAPTWNPSTLTFTPTPPDDGRPDEYGNFVDLATTVFAVPKDKQIGQQPEQV
jgi:hypothetical protein